MPVSPIQSISPNGQFESKFGTMYSFRYIFEDGTSGEASHKSNKSPFAIGQPVEYTVTGEFKGQNKLKVSRPQDNPAAHHPQPTTIGNGVPATTVPGIPVASTVFGATVGMAINNAAIDLREAHTDKLDDHEFVAKWVWTRASVYVKISQALESGKLSEAGSAKHKPVDMAPQAVTAPQPPPPAPTPRKPVAPSNGQAFETAGVADADIPF